MILVSFFLDTVYIRDHNYFHDYQYFLMDHISNITIAAHHTISINQQSTIDHENCARLRASRTSVSVPWFVDCRIHKMTLYHYGSTSSLTAGDARQAADEHCCRPVRAPRSLTNQLLHLMTSERRVQSLERRTLVVACLRRHDGTTESSYLGSSSLASQLSIQRALLLSALTQTLHYFTSYFVNQKLSHDRDTT